MADHRTYEQSVALAIVVASHLLLIVAFLYLTQRERSGALVDSQNRSILILIEPPDEPRVQRPEVAPPENRTDVENARSTRAITVPTLPSPSPPSPQVSLPREPPIDWRGEGERAARVTAEKLGRSEHRPFGEPREPSPGDDQPPPFEWDPEPKTVGFAGGLPYVRLGKRCALGLGFFGCALGKLPEANGDLFEHMRDPNLPESSVPDPAR